MATEPIKHLKQLADWLESQGEDVTAGETREIAWAFAQLMAERAELRSALEPFADQADCYDESVQGDVADWPTFKVRHFRQARAAIAKAEVA